MSLASQTIRPIAASGASSAPTVSSAWRRPKARPRISGGVSSAIIASRGAPRMPLPMRSTKRAAISASRTGREREQGLGQRRQAIAGEDPRLAPPAAVAEPAGGELGEIGGGFGDAVDRAQRRRRQAERDGHEAGSSA